MIVEKMNLDTSFLSPLCSDPTDIKRNVFDTKEKTSVYDLNGRPLLQPRKGMNIIKGKKVVIK